MMDYQKSLKSVELRKDMEAIMLGNQGQNAGGATTARTLRSFNAWFAGNALRGTAGADSTAATAAATDGTAGDLRRSEEHTSELQSLMRISYAVFCLKKKNT